ncbi:MAG: ribonuclease P protein component [Candidatus Krumholzibacteriota bacterium]|nr:ribonuclease P protein component [Candidatus Krumholzibacteriota bacterium]
MDMTLDTLKHTHQFRTVYRDGGRARGRRITVRFLPREEGGIVPGFVASKKNVGKACRRNRAKRWMREIYRRLRPRVGLEHAWIVFIAEFRPAETTFQELIADVESSLGRAGILTGCG